jgi:phenylacetate-CoA ligase
MRSEIVRHFIFPLHEMAVGRKTYQFLHELELLQWKRPQELEELKFRKLKKLLLHAQQNVPYYARRFSDAGFSPEKMQCIDDFKILPALTKADIRMNLDSITWKACPGGLHRYNTGGSSGEPLVFYFDRRRQAYDAAARALTHRWWGIEIGDKELYLWGSPLEIKKQDRIKTLRDTLTNQLLISAFEVSPRQIPEMVSRIRKFKPRCIFGYPSTIDLFCRMAAQQHFRLDDIGVQVAFCTAEVLYPHQKESISRHFGGIPVSDGYGSREGGYISNLCPEGTYHVIDPNYVIEYLKDGKEVGPGEEGEITITHLDAWGMPFIRYATGDIAQPGVGPCACGRGFSSMKAIRGRTTDFVVTPDGRWQHALSVIYVVRDIEGVAEFKIIQEDVDDIRVLLRIHDGVYPADGNDRIIKGFKKRMGTDVKVRIETVSDIPKDASGKHRYVVSKVAQQGIQ